MADFVTVAQVSEVPPGERIVVEYRRHWVAIFNVGGSLYAVEDMCTHDEGPLAEGELDDFQIICPRHGARFDITNGKALTAPAYIDVPTYEVQVSGEDIQLRPRKKA